MMTSDERRYAENRAVTMSRSLWYAAIACALGFGFVGLSCFVACIVFAAQMAGGAVPTMRMGGIDVSGAHAIARMLLGSATSLAIAFALRCAAKLCRNVEHGGTPFRPDNVRQLDSMGRCVFAAAFAWTFGGYALDFAFGADLTDISDVLWIWAGVVLIFLARVFEYGCALQEQDDELL